MTVIRKSLFTIFSASALIYLVLQTAQGKQWLDDTKLWLSLLASDNQVQEEKGIVNKGIGETDLTDNNLTDNNLTDKNLTQNEPAASKMINSDLLRTLKSDAKAVAMDVAQLRSEVTELKLDMQTVTTNKASIDNKDIHYKDIPNLSQQYWQQESQNTDKEPRQSEQAANLQMDVKQTQREPAVSQQAAKQLQREQQARLQDVVQRMELTALQALTR